MSYLEWDQTLDVLVADMNAEHKRWIALINKLHEVNLAKRSEAEILQAFDDMESYTKEHFGHEEEYLKSIKYPMMDMHFQEHTTFLARLHDARSQFTGPTFSDEFFNFLVDWLVRHIKIVDIRYGEYTERMKKAG